MGVTETAQVAASTPHVLQSHVAMPAPTVLVSTCIILIIELIFYFSLEEVIANNIDPW